MSTKNKGISLLGGVATAYPPTPTNKSWRIAYDHPVTGERKTTTAGKSLQEAEAKVAGILGHYVPEYQAKGFHSPTVKEVGDEWLDLNRGRWSQRTHEHYSHFARKIYAHMGDEPIKHVSPKNVRQINLNSLSRGQQKRFRSVVRSIFKHGAVHLRDTPEAYAQAVQLDGNKSADPMMTVSRGDIPSTRFVASVITCAFHTHQLGPLDERWYILNSSTGEKSINAKMPRQEMFTFDRGLGHIYPDDRAFLDGLPADYIPHMRMKSYPPQWGAEAVARAKIRETEKIAQFMRQTGLLAGLGAGGGFRISEELAFRPRHFLTLEQALEVYHKFPLHKSTYRGLVHVVEQAQRGAKGKMALSAPKGKKERTTHIPAFLPSWHTPRRGRLRDHIGKVVDRFNDENVSLWTATDEEIITLWKKGFTPLGWLLWRHFHEMMWLSVLPAVHETNGAAQMEAFLNMLMFPTLEKGRKQVKDTIPNVTYPSNWKYRIEVPAGTGTYQSISNFAQRYSNPLYDYVAEVLGEYPDHRTNSETRKGWTHHGLRHYSASSRISAGTPLTFVSEELGHSNPSFTLARYGHAVDYYVPNDMGYEF